MANRLVWRAGPDDIPALNDIVNQDDVWKWCADKPGKIDLSPLLHDVRARVYASAHGAISFLPLGSNEYWQFHTFYQKAGRGRHAYTATRFAFEDVFLSTDAKVVSTYTPDDAPHARPPKTFGFEPWFKCDDAVLRPDGDRVGAQYYKLPLERWLVKAPLEKHWLPKATCDELSKLDRRLSAALIASLFRGTYVKFIPALNHIYTSRQMSPIEVQNLMPLILKTPHKRWRFDPFAKEKIICL